MPDHIVRTGKVIFGFGSKAEALAEAARFGPGVVEIIEVNNRRGMKPAELSCSYLVWPIDQQCPVCDHTAETEKP